MAKRAAREERTLHDNEAYRYYQDEAGEVWCRYVRILPDGEVLTTHGIYGLDCIAQADRLEAAKAGKGA